MTDTTSDDVEEAQQMPLRQRPMNSRRGMSTTTTGTNNIAPPPIPSPHVFPARHPYNIIKRISIISGSFYGLHKMELWHAIQHESSKVGHAWFKVGLATCIAMQFIKSYVELYQGRWMKRRVEYQNFRTATHSILLLLLFSTLAFFQALQPQYGTFQTIFILMLTGWGIVLQIMLFVPSWIQNVMTFVSMAFFIQQYQ